MNRTTKQLGAVVLAAAGALAGLYGAAQAWEAFHLPRWAWLWELHAVAEEASDDLKALKDETNRTRYEFYLLNRSATENDITSLRVQIDGYQKNHEIAPPILVKALEEKQHDLERINKVIYDLQQ